MAERKLNKEAIKTIIKTYGRTDGPTSLGKKLGVSAQRIYQVAAMLRKAGVYLPRPRRQGWVMKAVFELKKENPELFEKRKKEHE